MFGPSSVPLAPPAITYGAGDREVRCAGERVRTRPLRPRSAEAIARGRAVSAVAVSVTPVERTTSLGLPTRSWIPVCQIGLCRAGFDGQSLSADRAAPGEVHCFVDTAAFESGDVVVFLLNWRTATVSVYNRTQDRLVIVRRVLALQTQQPVCLVVSVPFGVPCVVRLLPPLPGEAERKFAAADLARAVSMNTLSRFHVVSAFS